MKHKLAAYVLVGKHEISYSDIVTTAMSFMMVAPLVNIENSAINDVVFK